MGEKRDGALDYLRAIGTVLVIFAHITAPTGILEIRTFDVTMLVFVSGASYALSTREKQTLQIQNYLGYIFSRFKRLIIPTWIFLTMYFALFWLLTFCGIANVHFTLKDYIGSYFLVSGIGFVWVIRVYFLMAIIAPILLFAIRKTKSSTFYVFLIFAAVVQSVLVEFLKVENGAFWKIVELIIPYMIGYGIVYAFGMQYALCKKGMVEKLIIFGVIFFGYGIIMQFPSINAMKYPPHIYYLTYGLFVTHLIICAINVCGGKKSRAIQFVSRNSLLIYYWHAIPLRFIEYHIICINFDIWSKYLFVLVSALLLTCIHLQVKKLIENLIAKS